MSHSSSMAMIQTLFFNLTIKLYLIRLTCMAAAAAICLLPFVWEEKWSPFGFIIVAVLVHQILRYVMFTSTGWVFDNQMCSAFEPVRVKTGIYCLDLVALLGEIISNSMFYSVIKHSSKTWTVLSIHLTCCQVVNHAWSLEVAILHAFVGSLLALLILVMILRLAAIVRWIFFEERHDLGAKLDFLTTFEKGMQKLKGWEVLVGKSILKTHLPWVSHQYFLNKKKFISCDIAT